MLQVTKTAAEPKFWKKHSRFRASGEGEPKNHRLCFTAPSQVKIYFWYFCHCFVNCFPVSVSFCFGYFGGDTLSVSVCTMSHSIALWLPQQQDTGVPTCRSGRCLSLFHVRVKVGEPVIHCEVGEAQPGTGPKADSHSFVLGWFRSLTSSRSASGAIGRVRPPAAGAGLGPYSSTSRAPGLALHRKRAAAPQNRFK